MVGYDNTKKWADVLCVQVGHNGAPFFNPSFEGLFYSRLPRLRVPMINNYIATKDIAAYSSAANTLRYFFLERGFREVHTQDRLSILAACEDPTTVATFEYAGERWPLPQTGQM